MVTVKEIARACNVSPSTVSNILNGKENASEKTRQKVMAAVKELGYQPNFFAQSMRKQNSRIIGIITEDLNQFGTAPIVESIMAYCDDHEYRSILMNLRLYHKWSDTWYEDETKLKTVLEPVLQEALSIRVEGLLYVAGHCRTINVFPDDLSIPLVSVYGLSGNDKYPSIVIDDEKGGYDMTRYLIERGHTKIGLIAGVEGNLHTQSRLKGYQKALFEGNILYNPQWVQYGDWNRRSGYRAAEHLLQDDVTALFCMNDVMAAGAYDLIEEKNLIVGKDISVVGYDNSDIADYFRPGLTTNEIPLREIGRKSAETLLGFLKKGGNDAEALQVIRIPCKMVERNSVS